MMARGGGAAWQGAGDCGEGPVLAGRTKRALAQTCVTGPWVEMAAGVTLVIQRNQAITVTVANGQNGATVTDATLYQVYSQSQNPDSGARQGLQVT